MRAIQFLMLLFLLFFVACEDGEEKDLQSAYVVEAWIENDGYPIVKLTRSVPVNKDNRTSIDSLENYIVKWARVTISDGDREVTLTGSMDHAYFPPYIYTTTEMKGKAGKTYTLTVYRKDEPPIVSTATIPLNTVQLIDSFSYERISSSDTLYQVYAHVNIPSTPTTYYRLFVNTILNLSQDFTPSFLGVLRSDMIPDGKIAVNQGRAKVVFSNLEMKNLIQNDDFTPYFSVGDTIMVRFALIDSITYNYWRSYEDMLSLSRVPLFPSTTNMPMQIQGVYGFWQGWNSSYHLVTIPK